MSDQTKQHDPNADLFRSAQWYDRAVNWSARIAREVPILTDLFGPPGASGLLDPGCGTGRQACALADRGYRVVGADASAEMLTLAQQIAAEGAVKVEYIEACYADLHDKVGGGFDGLYCLGNALAAAGSKDVARDAIAQFAACLRPGGRLFMQILNFEPMREEFPCVRGPRVSTVDGQDYISVRQFHFADDAVQVSSITLWDDDGWHKEAHGGRLYPVGREEVCAWCTSAGLRVDELWGGYDRAPFDVATSVDLIVVGTRV